MDEVTPGRTAYEAYVSQTGGVSAVTGEDLPLWFEVHDAVRNAWEAAAGAVLARHGGSPGDASSGVRF